MDGEIGTFIKIWSTAFLSASYTYTLSKTTNPGPIRFLLLLPVAAFFATAFSFLSSLHLLGTTWFFLTWLGVSKLLLFSAGAGPLSRPGLSLPLFVSSLLFPIKIDSAAHSPANPDLDPGNPAPPRGFLGIAVVGVKVVGLLIVIEGYNYRDRMPGLVVWGLYCCHLYLALDIELIIGGAAARGVVKVAPQSDQPYLSSSLQDFWGRRWNLMVSDILRQTVHNPLRSITSPLIGHKSATLIGVFTTFIVSGLMHEWIFSYITSVAPTWEVTWFFVLHGACMVIELVIKITVSNKRRLPRAISGPLTFGFVTITAAWLFFPPLIRNNVHERAIDEYAIIGNFAKRSVLYLYKQMGVNLPKFIVE